MAVRMENSDFYSMYLWFSAPKNANLLQSIASISVFFTSIFAFFQIMLITKSVKNDENQSVILANQMKIQTIFQMWKSHIDVNHAPIINGSDRLVNNLKISSPYYDLNPREARIACFADSVFDMYECIFLTVNMNLLDSEIEHIWKESVFYELQNKFMINHWKKYHHYSSLCQPIKIYHEKFRNMIDDKIDTLI